MMIQYINQYPENEEFDYAKRLRLLRERKLAQTAEKVKREGGLNEDDYGRVVAPDYFKFKIVRTDIFTDTPAGRRISPNYWRNIRSMSIRSMRSSGAVSFF